MLDFIKTALSADKVEMLKVITPANHVQAKKEWLEQAERGHFTNPTFIYNSDRDACKAALSKWNDLCARWLTLTPRDKKEQLLHEFVSDYLNRQRTIRLIALSIANNDDALTNHLMVKHYGKTSPELVQLAYGLANSTATVSFPLLDALPRKVSPDSAMLCVCKDYEAADIKKLFDAILEDYCLQDTWKVVIDDAHSAICVTSLTSEGDSRIYIPRTRVVNEIKAIQLGGHEVENHVRHNENCICFLQDRFDLSRDIAAKLVSDRDGTLTEGFAKMSDAIVNKRCLGTDDGTPEPWYIIMADLAKKGESFAQITERIHTEWNVDLDKCFTHAIRIFRGCHDMTNPHSFSRQADRSYLEGYVKAIELSKKNSPLSDFAKFDEDLFAKITELFGEPTAKYPHLDIANKIINSI